MNLTVQETTLPNGIRILSSAMPGARSTALGIWVGAGGRHECRTLNGISHFVEHMLFKGTTHRTAREITRAIEGRGGHCNAFTQEENTCYYARMAGHHLPEVMDIMTEMYLHPRFAADDVVREKGVILEELLMVNDQPEQLVHEMLAAMLWRNHELGRPLTGTQETLQRFTREHLLNYKKKKYAPENTVFVLAGKVDHQACVAQIKNQLRHVRRKAAPNYRLVTAAVGQEPFRLSFKKIEQTQLALGFRIFGRFDQRRHALRLLNVILGENMSSRLFQSLREEHGLAYAVSSSAQLFAETGALVIGAGVDSRRAERSLELILRELHQLKKTGPTGRELNEAREYVIGHMLLALESPAGHMHWMGESILNYGRVVQPEEIIASMRGITTGVIKNLAGEILRRKNASLAVLAGEDANLRETSLRKTLDTI
ncbi:MAG: M16 family metallopeptidase [Kiritimatiellia bacterium]|nr:insulinase family protein [Lentisphaerota bacterium]